MGGQRIRDFKSSFFERFIPEPNSGCWIWTGPYNGKMGYGKLAKKWAHRLSWEIHNGKIPEGKFVLHHCDVTSCVNPDHLYVGTLQNNSDDCVKRGRHAVSTLTYQDVAEIRATTNMTHRALAVHFGVHHKTIQDVLNRKIWKTI